MTLKEYMEINEYSLRGLEAEIGINYRVIHRYVSGLQIPNTQNLYKIYMFTNKEVTLEDWFENDNN